MFICVYLTKLEVGSGGGGGGGGGIWTSTKRSLLYVFPHLRTCTYPPCSLSTHTKPKVLSSPPPPPPPPFLQGQGYQPPTNMVLQHYSATEQPPAGPPPPGAPTLFAGLQLSPATTIVVQVSEQPSTNQPDNGLISGLPFNLSSTWLFNPSSTCSFIHF